MNPAQVQCDRCRNPVKDSNDCCIHCGSLSRDNLACCNHPSIAATGVCVVCSLPWCDVCGALVDYVSLCETRTVCETYEGMARMYGSSDAVRVDFFKSCLRDAGLHPFVYSRKSSSTKGGTPATPSFAPGGNMTVILPMNSNSWSRTTGCWRPNKGSGR